MNGTNWENVIIIWQYFSIQWYLPLDFPEYSNKYSFVSSNTIILNKKAPFGWSFSYFKQLLVLRLVTAHRNNPALDVCNNKYNNRVYG